MVFDTQNLQMIGNLKIQRGSAGLIKKERTQCKILGIHRDETQIVKNHVKVFNFNGSKDNTKLSPLLGKKMAPKDVPRNCNYVHFHCKGAIKFAHQLPMRWGDYPGLLEWALGNRRDPCKWKRASGRVRAELSAAGSGRLL